MKKLLVILAMVVTACSSTGVVPIGQETYMLAKTSPACGFRSADATKADLYREANDFCLEQKKQLETVKVTARDGIPFVRCASAELQFRCVEGTVK